MSDSSSGESHESHDFEAHESYAEKFHCSPSNFLFAKYAWCGLQVIQICLTSKHIYQPQPGHPEKRAFWKWILKLIEQICRGIYFTTFMEYEFYNSIDLHSHVHKGSAYLTVPKSALFLLLVLDALNAGFLYFDGPTMAWVNHNRFLIPIVHFIEYFWMDKLFLRGFSRSLVSDINIVALAF